MKTALSICLCGLLNFNLMACSGNFSDRPSFSCQTQKPGFYENLGNKPRILERNPVSPLVGDRPSQTTQRNRVSMKMLGINRKLGEETRFLISSKELPSQTTQRNRVSMKMLGINRES